METKNMDKSIGEKLNKIREQIEGTMIVTIGSRENQEKFDIIEVKCLGCEEDCDDKDNNLGDAKMKGKNEQININKGVSYIG